MDRLLNIANDGEMLFRGYFGDSIIYLKEKYRDIKYIKSINDQISFAYKKAGQEGKNEVDYLGIMYLNSSLWAKSYELLISLYNKEFYLDPAPIEHYFQIPLFFEEFENNMIKVLKQLKHSYSKLQSYEIQKLEKKCINYYYVAIYKLLFDLQKELIFPNNTILFWGKYQGKAYIINGGQE